MNNEKLGADPQMYAGGDAKQAVEFAWPKIQISNLTVWEGTVIMQTGAGQTCV